MEECEVISFLSLVTHVFAAKLVLPSVMLFIGWAILLYAVTKALTNYGQEVYSSNASSGVVI